MSKTARSVSLMLKDYSAGKPDALEAIIPLVYEELRRIARRQLWSYHRNVTLSPTALVHELFVRLKKSEPLNVENRKTLYMAAAHCMKQILIDAARKKKTQKRGGDKIQVDLGNEIDSAAGLQMNPDIETINGLLKDLAELSSELSQIVELRYLVGLSIEETAEVLGSSPRTIRRRWMTARAWLLRELTRN